MNAEFSRLGFECPSCGLLKCDRYANNFRGHSTDDVDDGRWLIAKHKALDVLQRLQERQKDVCEVSFETTLSTRVPKLLFRFSDGHQLHSLVGTFRRLMRDSGLALDANGDNRTLYSLRHTYAAMEMLRG
jgi:integrase